MRPLCQRFVRQGLPITSKIAASSGRETRSALSYTIIAQLGYRGPHHGAAGQFSDFTGVESRALRQVRPRGIAPPRCYALTADGGGAADTATRLHGALRGRSGGADLHRCSHPGGEDHPIGHLIDVDAHRNALRQPHPGEDRVNVGKPLPVGLRIRDIDTAGDAADMAANDLAVAHQLDAGQVAYLDPVEIGLLEIAVDPE